MTRAWPYHRLCLGQSPRCNQAVARLSHGYAPDAEEAAQLDGASNWRILLTITAPMLAGASPQQACWSSLCVGTSTSFPFTSRPITPMTMPPFLASQMTTREQMAASEPDDYARLAVVAVLMIAPLILSLGIFSRLLARLGREPVMKGLLVNG